MSKAQLLERITIEPGKCGGRPRVRGQRMRVQDVLELLSAGASYDEILADYRFLERDDILACIEFAAHQTDCAMPAQSSVAQVTATETQPRTIQTRAQQVNWQKVDDILARVPNKQPLPGDE